MREIPPWFGLTAVPAAPREVVVVGCPYDGAASGRTGASAGPGAMRAWSRCSDAVDERGRPIAGLRVIDRGDCEPTSPEAITEHAARSLAAHPGAVLLGLGGDHSVTPALLSAVRALYPELGLVTIDAHADLFPDYEGDRHSHACTVARVWELGVPPERTALAGLRSYARVELASLQRCGAVVSAAEWSRNGSGRVADRLLQTVAGHPYYLSIDIDGLDPAAAPGTGYPVAGGPTSREVLDLLERLLGEQAPVALDLVEVAPPLDPTGVTAATAAQLLLQTLAGLATSPGFGASVTR